MDSFNVSSIRKKVQEFIDSPEGKSKAEEYMKSAAQSNNGTTVSGDKVITPELIKEAAEVLLHMFESYANASTTFPESVANLIKSMTTTEIAFDFKSPTQEVIIGFPNAAKLRRNSLYNIKNGKKVYTGDGIDNIVSLFDTGYMNTANADFSIGWVKGHWEGHQYNGKDVYINNRTNWTGEYFMRDIIKEFNEKYGDMYHCTASIIADMKYYAR